jgi:hypothetical protein
MFDPNNNPLSALGAPPAPEQAGTAAPVNETAAPQQPQQQMAPGVAPSQSFTNPPKQSMWMSVVQGALQGLAASGGATSFGGGLGRGAAGVMAAQRQQMLDEEDVKFKNQQSAAAASVAARQNFELTKLKQDARIEADNHQIGLINWYAKTFNLVPSWVSDDDSESAMQGLRQMGKNNPEGVGQFFTMHLGDAGDKGKIIAFTAPPPSEQLNFINEARLASGAPKLTEAQFNALSADAKEDHVMSAGNLWMPDMDESKLGAQIARYKGLKDTYLQRGSNGEPSPEKRTEVAERFDSIINMLKAAQADSVTRKLDFEKKKASFHKSNNAAPAPAVPQGATGEAALVNLNPADAALVRKIANYDIDPRTLSTRGGHREKMLGLAALYDNSYDQTQYNAKNKARTDFTSGKNGQNIRAFNTAIGHLGQLYDAADALNNNDVQKLNQVANAIGVQTGSSAPVVFDAIRAAVAGELATTFKGAAGTDPEIKSIVDTLHSKQSPQQTRDVSKAYIGLLNSRLHVLNEQYKQAMGKPADFHILHPESQAVIEHMGVSGSHNGSPKTKTYQGATYVQQQDGSWRKQ